MTPNRFMKLYMLVFGPAALIMVAFSLKIWEHELGRALIWCAAAWLIISLVVIAASLWQVRHK
jgi:hypothetical protein